MFQRVLARRDAHLEQKKRKQRIALRVLPVIAGFGFAVLFGWHVWERQEKIPTAPYVPASTTTGETFITTAAETTSMTVTESQTTGVQAEKHTTNAETTAISAVREPVPSTTVVSTRMTTVIETAAMTAPPTEAPEAKTQQSTPAFAPTLSTQQQTSLTARSANPALIQPVTTRQSTAVTTTVEITTTSESQISPTEPYSDQPETVPNAPSVPSVKGFVLEKLQQVVDEKSSDKKNVWHITAEPQDDDPTDYTISYAMQGDRFQIESEEMRYGERYYHISDTEQERHFTIRQQKRREFFYYWRERDTEYLLPFAGEINGFYAYETDKKQYYICWDDGNYIMTIRTEYADLVDETIPEQFRANG